MFNVGLVRLMAAGGGRVFNYAKVLLEIMFSVRP